MSLQPLPPLAQQILTSLDAPPRLVAHLTLVHDVAFQLVALVAQHWPKLTFEQEAVLIGAATHDIGKVLVTAELTKPGKAHEELGEKLLLAQGLAPHLARFAHTHALWNKPGEGEGAELTLEDLLVAFADKIWKGQRHPPLEQSLTSWLAKANEEEEWTTYLKLDEIASQLAKEADWRLSWQTQHPLSSPELFARPSCPKC